MHTPLIVTTVPGLGGDMSCQPVLTGTTLPSSSMKRKLTNAHTAVFAIYFICACDFSLKFPLATTLKAGNLRINPQSLCLITFGKGHITQWQNNCV